MRPVSDTGELSLRSGRHLFDKLHKRTCRVVWHCLKLWLNECAFVRSKSEGSACGVSTFNYYPDIAIRAILVMQPDCIICALSVACTAAFDSAQTRRFCYSATVDELSQCCLLYTSILPLVTVASLTVLPPPLLIAGLVQVYSVPFIVMVLSSRLEMFSPQLDACKR